MKKKLEGSNNKICVILSPLKSNLKESITLFKNIKEIKEMKKLKEMAEFDAKYIEKKGYKIIHSFIGPKDYNKELSIIFNEIAESKPDEILICFTAHGSPGENGQIGLDSNDGLGIDDLISCLKNAQLKKLNGLNLKFEFRSCNSAYAPIPMLIDTHYAQKCKKQIPENDEKSILDDLLDKTLIGVFQKKLSEKLSIKASVSGVRGYYCPQQNEPMVSGKYDSKYKFHATDFTVVITENREVKANLKNLIKMNNISDLEERFEKKIESSYSKN